MLEPLLSEALARPEGIPDGCPQLQPQGQGQVANAVDDYHKKLGVLTKLYIKPKLLGSVCVRNS